MTEAEALSAVDREYLVRCSMAKGYQFTSLLAPTLYTAIVLARRRSGALPWSLNRMLRATWIGGVAGITQGGALELLRTANEDDYTLRTRHISSMYNRSSARADDHSTIGALLGTLLIPAIFWKRAGKVHLFLGGAGIGTGAGLMVHWFKLATGDRPPQISPPVLSPPHPTPSESTQI